MSGPLLQVEGLEKHFPVTAGVLGRVVAKVKAVDGVSFEVEAGTTLGLVGESGCGKTTVGQTVLRLLEPTAGRVLFEGEDIATLPEDVLRKRRRDMQIVFQDPFNSLNPRMTVADIVGEAMRVHGLATRDDVEEKVGRILERVGIPADWMNRYPHEFSGGQRQRISIARAIALEPRLVVCDEAVSALDVSIQAQVINLLIGLQKEMGLSYLFISHDLSVVKHISDRIAVMYLGQIVETAPSEQLFQTPAHPYTRALLSAIPIADPTRRPERIVLEGDVPTPLDPPPGCHFHTRCPAAMERCRREEPPVFALPGDQSVRCFLAEGQGADSGDGWYEAVLERTRAAQAERAAEATPSPARTPEHAAASPAAPTSSTTSERVEETHRIRPWIAAAGLLAAAVFLLSGWGWTGVLLAAVVHRFALHPALPTARRIPVAAGVVVGVVLCALGGRALMQRVDVERARTQQAELVAAIEDFAAVRGELPGTLQALGWRLPDIVGDTAAHDPWGRPWRYQPDATGTFALGSVGPDGVAGTADDIGDLPSEPAP